MVGYTAITLKGERSNLKFKYTDCASITLKEIILTLSVNDWGNELTCATSTEVSTFTRNFLSSFKASLNLDSRCLISSSVTKPDLHQEYNKTFIKTQLKTLTYPIANYIFANKATIFRQLCYLSKFQVQKQKLDPHLLTLRLLA